MASAASVDMQYLAHPFGSYADAADYHPFWLCSPRWYHPLIECWHPLFSQILSLILLLRRDVLTNVDSGPSFLVSLLAAVAISSSGFLSPPSAVGGSVRGCSERAVFVVLFVADFF